MPAKLIVLSDPPSTHTLGAFNTIGRHPANTIQILDRIISKEHARISLGPGGQYSLKDAGSLNGTLVNGKKVAEHRLQNGDLIKLGNTEVRFELAEQDERRSAVDPGRVKLAQDDVQNEVHRSIDASHRFLPAAEIRDEESLREDYEKLRAAHILSQNLAVDTDLDRILKQIVDQSFRLIPADRAVILLQNSDTGELVPAYTRQNKDSTDEIVLSTSILDEVRKHKKAVLCSNAMMDPRFKESKSIITQGIRSTMCVPLLVSEEIVGIFHMDTMLATGVFTEKDLVLFSGIATQAAIAIENHRLARKIEKEASTRAQFQRLLSPNLVEQVVGGALTLNQQGQRCEVTMLFADIRGFTSMSERHTPEQMVAILNDYFEVMVEVLFRHGGTLDKYVGDELIGLFGAPVAQSDAPLRALRCAIDMMESLEAFNLGRAQRGEDAISIGIGINTGPVIAGAMGSSQTLQYTVIGDAVNVAARLCSAAGPNEILISQSTYDLTHSQIDVEARSPIKVKGKAKALKIYCLSSIT